MLFVGNTSWKIRFRCDWPFLSVKLSKHLKKLAIPRIGDALLDAIFKNSILIPKNDGQISTSILVFCNVLLIFYSFYISSQANAFVLPDLLASYVRNNASLIDTVKVVNIRATVKKSVPTIAITLPDNVSAKTHSEVRDQQFNLFDF